MGKQFTFQVELQGIDDASDEMKAVQQAMQEVRKAGEMTVERAKEVLKAAREQKQVLKAVAEESQVFGDRMQFMANQLNTVAGFGAKVNSIYNSVNTMMTRLNTAQIALNQAQAEQARLLDEVNARFGLQASSISEAIVLLNEYRADVRAAGGDTKELDRVIKELTQSEKEVAKAASEVAAAQTQAAQQMVALSIQAIGLVPAFMQTVNAMSTLAHMLPTLGGALGTVKSAFMGLYAAMGPIGLVLMAIGVILPVIAMHWDQITAALRAAGEAVWSVIGPALQWLWDNILKPLFDFIWSIALQYLKGFIVAWEALEKVVKVVGDALDWVKKNIIEPVMNWLVESAKKNLELWVGAFMWAKEQIEKIFNAIKGIVEGVINWIRDAINGVVDAIRGAFDWLYQQLVGGSIIPDMWEDIREWTKWGVKEMNKLMGDVGLEFNPAIRGPVSINVAVNVTSPAASAEEIAELVSREIVRRLRAI